MIELEKAVQLIREAADVGVLCMPTPTTVVVYHEDPNAGWYEDDLLEAALSISKEPDSCEMLRNAISEKKSAKGTFTPDPPGFEDFLIGRQDQATAAATQMLASLLRNNAEEPEKIHSAELVWELIDMAAAILESHNIPVCNPYWEGCIDPEKPDNTYNENGDLACVRGTGCDKKQCPFLR